MALKSAPAPSFEEPEGEETTVETVATTAAPTTTALAPQKASPLAVAPTAKGMVTTNVLTGFKDAFRVEYDSLPAITATQGSFAFKDNDAELGSEIQMQLLSHQESWACSPNDSKADKNLVKFADNATTARDGTNLQQHLEDLKEQGYTKAKIAHRCIIVGELLASKGDQSRIGELVQIDLPDTGRKSFNTYSLQASYAVAKGRKTTEEASVLKMTAVKDKLTSGEVYTKVAISGL